MPNSFRFLDPFFSGLRSVALPINFLLHVEGIIVSCVAPLPLRRSSAQLRGDTNRGSSSVELHFFIV